MIFKRTRGAGTATLGATSARVPVVAATRTKTAGVGATATRAGATALTPPPGSNSTPLTAATFERPAPPSARISSIRPAKVPAPAPKVKLVDVVVPLELELDGDPTREDEVRLENAARTFSRTLKASDPAVKRDAAGPVLLYAFTDVPEGEYILSIRIGDVWCPVVAGLEVRAAGLAVHGEDASGARDADRLGTPEADDDDAPACAGDHEPEYQDFDFDFETE